jgi:hypothetical protein
LQVNASFQDRNSQKHTKPSWTGQRGPLHQDWSADFQKVFNEIVGWHHPFHNIHITSTDLLTGAAAETILVTTTTPTT